MHKSVQVHGIIEGGTTHGPFLAYVHVAVLVQEVLAGKLLTGVAIHAHLFHRLVEIVFEARQMYRCSRGEVFAVFAVHALVPVLFFVHSVIVMGARSVGTHGLFLSLLRRIGL